MTIAPPQRRMFGAKDDSGTIAQHRPSDRNTFRDRVLVNPIAPASLSMWSWNRSTLAYNPRRSAKKMSFWSLVESMFRGATP